MTCPKSHGSSEAKPGVNVHQCFVSSWCQAWQTVGLQWMLVSLFISLELFFPLCHSVHASGIHSQLLQLFFVPKITYFILYFPGVGFDL